MGELRKDTCDICGWTMFIAETQVLRLAPPKFGSKEIRICVGCKTMRDSPHHDKRLMFEEYYAYAARGTQGKPSETVKAPVPSATEPTDDIGAPMRRIIAIRWFLRGLLLGLGICGVLIFSIWSLLKSFCGF